MRRFHALVLALTLAAPVRARAADDKQACIAASEKAQQLRADGKLTASREQLLFCARDVCPGVVRKDCARWLGEVEEALPTIVLAARDGDGHDIANVKVYVDDKLFAPALEGKAQSIDPGTHVVKFERESGEVVTENVLIREGEKNRIVTGTFASPKTEAPPSKSPVAFDSKPAPPPAAEGSSRTAAWVLSGVGVVALGSFAYFGITGRNDASDLRSTCAPACAQSDVDSVRTRLLVADLSLGVSLLSFGVATYLFVSSGSNEKRTAVVVQPLSSGGSLSLVGRF